MAEVAPWIDGSEARPPMVLRSQEQLGSQDAWKSYSLTGSRLSASESNGYRLMEIMLDTIAAIDE
ncbi:hypothetical protein ACFL2Q_06620 [Thermodesulfobacteriota bacterium]